MSKRRRVQRWILGALMGAVAGLLDRRVRRKLGPREPRSNIEASDR